ncbi:acyl-CoA thioesterase [Aquibacillus koreensis]|uniref:Acyl-CoA thioesterase n=1 Tax=Aquibacillus koreensis TaxID=279446 RepID=A0A9X4AGL9_9BACI|nr:thioesterase family protein [Aquibacillus koreensis]MCT2535082.1 acyl-CoA thioesterase [Aquibacillus koreensis]MDC3419197.1 acyl-CoA thioesterase [Aquibacillus koreensis]
MKQIDYIEDFELWKNEFSFSIDVHPRFQETDMFGHVNNTSIFIYFEEARVEFLKKAGLFTDFKDKPIPIVADLQCDYLKQVYFDDELSLFVKMNSIGTTSFDLHYLGVNQSGDVCMTGRGRMVQINPKTGKPAPIDEETKIKLQSL